MPRDPRSSRSRRRRALACAVGLGLLVAAPRRAEAAAPWTDPDDRELHIVEIGVAGGVVALSELHGLYRPGVAGWKRFQRPTGELTLRLGYYPIRVVGVELAGRLIPGRVETGSRATAYSIRAQLIGQLPYRATPFFTGGLELLGVGSSIDALGNDLDVGGHIGAGFKFYVTSEVAVRVGVSGMFHEGVGPRNTAHVEADLGLSMVLGRRDPS